MKMNVGFSQFVDAFHDMGRGEQFTYQGKRALFDYLEELGEDTGEEIELDVIALCCEYSEYSSALEAYKDNQGKEWYSDNENETEAEAECRDWLQERTTVIEAQGVFIIAQF